jgi:hypothetical protein
MCASASCSHYSHERGVCGDDEALQYLPCIRVRHVEVRIPVERHTDRRSARWHRPTSRAGRPVPPTAASRSVRFGWAMSCTAMAPTCSEAITTIARTQEAAAAQRLLSRGYENMCMACATVLRAKARVTSRTDRHSAVDGASITPTRPQSRPRPHVGGTSINVNRRSRYSVVR